jgi:hypothetical protein
MSIYNNIVYGFLLGSGSKIMDDIFDIYGKDSINAYVLEILKILLVTIFANILVGLYDNYFMYWLIFNQWWPAIVLPDAFTTEPYWAGFTILLLLFTTYNIIIKFTSKSIHLILLYNIIFYVQWFSGFSTEVGEWVPYIKIIKKYFPSLYPYFFLDEDVEISEKKMFFRFLNVLLCIYMVLFGNNQILNYFTIEEPYFISILPITSYCILGYNLISVINQGNMIFLNKTNIKLIHEQVNGFFGIDIKSIK